MHHRLPFNTRPNPTPSPANSRRPRRRNAHCHNRHRSPQIRKLGLTRIQKQVKLFQANKITKQMLPRPGADRALTTASTKDSRSPRSHLDGSYYQSHPIHHAHSDRTQARPQLPNRYRKQTSPNRHPNSQPNQARNTITTIQQ